MSKSRDIADSAATINYIDTVTSNVQDQIDNIDPLPSQTGNSGLFLTTDGTDASWGAAGGGAWELLATYNPSGASSLDIEDFSSTYDDYVILINNLESNSSSTVLRSYFKLNGSYFTGGSNEYMYNIQYNAATASSTVSNGGSNGTSFQYATVMGALGEPNNAIAYIQNVNETGIRHSYHVSTQSTSTALIAKWENLLSVNSSISGANLTELQGIRFFASGFTFSGTFKVYGIKKA
jgi:hypothetical protein